MKRVSGGDMEKVVYDTDGDAVVDRAGGVKTVDDFPSSPVVGDVVVKAGKAYVYTSE